MKISGISVDQIFLQDGKGLELPMHELSDGYRGVYALVLDLIQAMADAYGVEGLVCASGGWEHGGRALRGGVDR
ncbi:MAG: hypothetical protein HQL91_04740 [Magnetococcales bacterium]|nr:hypothetical protein [Magnetococcales bacterium]